MNFCASSSFRWLFLLVGTIATFSMMPFASAQVLVDLSIKRTLYLAYEPLLATVRITNLSGNRLLLADVESKKWFGFHIETLEGQPIPPTDPNYEIPPIQLNSGESITRTVNLTQLYPLSDFGSYRIRANVYAAELNGYFSSPPLTVEITEGRIIWEQTVGIPRSEGASSDSRTITLLSYRLPEKTALYLRIKDKGAGIVYCTYNLGDFLAYAKPDVLLDSENTIHVLQNSAPHEFVYSKVGLNGKILARASYQPSKDRPQLKRNADGTITVLGGIVYDPHATPTPSLIPKLSDRPPVLPLSEATPQTKGEAKLTGPHPKSSPGKTSNKSPTPRPTPTKID